MGWLRVNLNFSFYLRCVIYIYLLSLENFLWLNNLWLWYKIIHTYFIRVIFSVRIYIWAVKNHSCMHIPIINIVHVIDKKFSNSMLKKHGKWMVCKDIFLCIYIYIYIFKEYIRKNTRLILCGIWRGNKSFIFDLIYLKISSLH